MNIYVKMQFTISFDGIMMWFFVVLRKTWWDIILEGIIRDAWWLSG